jgi:hypothetical protein
MRARLKALKQFDSIGAPGAQKILRRGAIEPPVAGAARAARREGFVLLIGGVPLTFAALLLLLVPLMPVRIVAILVAIPGAAGVIARGLHLRAQAKRWELKQRLYDEMRAPEGSAASGGTESVAVPPFRR